MEAGKKRRPGQGANKGQLREINMITYPSDVRASYMGPVFMSFKSAID